MWKEVQMVRNWEAKDKSGEGSRTKILACCLVDGLRQRLWWQLALAVAWNNWPAKREAALGHWEVLAPWGIGRYQIENKSLYHCIPLPSNHQIVCWHQTVFALACAGGSVPQKNPGSIPPMPLWLRGLSASFGGWVHSSMWAFSACAFGPSMWAGHAGRRACEVQQHVSHNSVKDCC